MGALLCRLRQRVSPTTLIEAKNSVRDSLSRLRERVVCGANRVRVSTASMLMMRAGPRIAFGVRGCGARSGDVLARPMLPSSASPDLIRGLTRGPSEPLRFWIPGSSPGMTVGEESAPSRAPTIIIELL